MGVTPAGSRNQRFGSHGLVFPNQSQSIRSAAAIQRDGRIVLASAVVPGFGTSRTITVRRLTASGHSDPLFPIRRFTPRPRSGATASPSTMRDAPSSGSEPCPQRPTSSDCTSCACSRSIHDHTGGTVDTAGTPRPNRTASHAALCLTIAALTTDAPSSAWVRCRPGPTAG